MSASLPTTMLGMEIISDGPNAGLHASRFPLPRVGAGDVLIRVAYAGVNRADLLQLEGNYAPPEDASPLPGLEVSGHIAALGANAPGFSLGQPVCALLSGGGYAEYVSVPQGQVLPLPGSLSLQEAATLPEAAATSVMALECEAALRSGERVLIHGGTSGLGVVMTQIAKRWGAEVYATVGSDEKADFLRKLDIHPINHRHAPFADQLMTLTKKQGVDIIIDTLGGPAVETHFRCLRKGGRLITLAMLEGSEVSDGFKMTRLLMNHLTWRGATLRSRTPAEKAQIMDTARARVWPSVAHGAIHPHIARCFPLREAEKALAHMQERLHMGKILLEVSAE